MREASTALALWLRGRCLCKLNSCWRIPMQPHGNYVRTLLIYWPSQVVLYIRNFLLVKCFHAHSIINDNTARRIFGRGAVCACHIYCIRVGCGFSVLSVFCRDRLPWTLSWDHFWMRDAIAYRSFPVAESVDTLVTE